jgi:hypothetical protein
MPVSPPFGGAAKQLILTETWLQSSAHCIAAGHAAL